MTTVNFNELSEDNKVVFFLALSERVVSVFSNSEDQKIAINSIDECWRWLEEKKNDGEKLYEQLDNEENGITILQEMTDNVRDEEAWNCIIDAVAYTSRKAYEREGVKYFPEPIGLVDDSLVDHFIDCFEKCVDNSNEYISKTSTFLDANRIEDTPCNLRKNILRELQLV
ncbi:immunity 6 family protein [Metabacillus sp. GX 13764]|uniref:Imm6 family immunity protein n=1 Tax=Metabacillus kandeliae TaxID=2900151 RepID=UPI001E641D42|nr:Imm6 family immunity protein [Metabacillus kandeliae]MCD7035989.1 immunity 6 family protein [Metabacillus kandeliae]